MAKILVVDDVPANRALVVTLVRHVGHEAIEASDGAQALAMARMHRPDLVISDVLMPTMDGFEFVRQLRADASVAATQVVFYTAHFREGQARQLALACGVTEILLKPCEPEEILRVVERALAQALQAAPVLEDVGAFDAQHMQLITDKLTASVAQLEAINSRLAALTDLSLQLASEHDPDVLLAHVCRGARDLGGASFVVLCVRQTDADTLALFSCGLPESDAHDGPVRQAPALTGGLLARLAQERRALRWSGPASQSGAVGLPQGYPAVTSALVVPVLSASRSYGWICLADKSGADAFTGDDAQILSILGAQVGRMYENASLLRQVQGHAIHLQQEVQERLRALDHLQASKASLRRAQTLARISHITSNAGGVIESWHETLPPMLRLTPELMPRSVRQWLEMVHPDDRAKFRNHSLQAAHDGSRMDFTYRLLRGDGETIYLRQVMEPLEARTAPDGGQTGHWFHTIQDVTRHRRAEDELRESDRRFNHLFDKVEMISIMLDCEGRITYCNDYLLRLTGWRRAEVVGHDWFARFLPGDQAPMRKVFADLLQDLPSAWHHDNDILTRSGNRRTVHWNNTVLRSADGAVTGVASLGEDITESREAEHKIRRLNRVYAVLSGINTLIVRVRDRNELFQEACRVAVELGGFKAAWIGRVDRQRQQVLPVASAGAGAQVLMGIRERLYLHDTPQPGESLSASVVRNRRPELCDDILGDPRIVQRDQLAACGVAAMVVLPLLASAQVVGVMALFADEKGFFDEAEMRLLTELAGDVGFAMDHLDKEERLSYLAYYDDITGLPNRNLFLERAGQQLRPQGGVAPMMGVALIDISRFRMVNDTLGRQVGDELLRQVGQRLAKAAGEACGLGRVGINGFGVAVPGMREASAVATLVDQLLRACFDAPFTLASTELRMAAKAGVAMYPSDGADAEALLRNAEAALNQAKASAESMMFYTSAMNASVAEVLGLEGRLRGALEQGQFVLHYQPKLHLSTGQLTGAEALIRWNDPERGLVPPGQFIPVLEETGLIYDVGRWALRQALADAQRWREAGHVPLRVAVNVSFLQLRHRGFIDEVRSAMGPDPRSAASLEIEITESMVMGDVDHSSRSLHALRQMGITIAIDDFGTGFSSLSHLATLPVDTLKIDQSFVKNMHAMAQGQALVATIINLGHSLGLKVIAEGVETPEQRNTLAALGCDEMQGYLLSRPVPADEFEARFLQG